jgi:hypothetical protein
LIILVRLLLLKAIAYKPLEFAEFGRTVSQRHLAAVQALLQLQALQRAKDAARPVDRGGAYVGRGSSTEADTEVEATSILLSLNVKTARW